MVSLVPPTEHHAPAQIALRWLGLPTDSNWVKTSVITLPDELGYAVTVVQMNRTLQMRLLYIDWNGNVRTFGARL